MFSFQMYQKAFPLERNLDDVPPACEGVQCSAVQWRLWQQRHDNELWTLASPIHTRERNWSRSCCGILRRHLRSDPPSERCCYYPEGGEDASGEKENVCRMRVLEKLIRTKLNEEWNSGRWFYRSSMQLHSIKIQCACRVEETKLRLALLQGPGEGHKHKHTEHESNSARHLDAAPIWGTFCQCKHSKAIGFLEVWWKQRRE